MPEREQRSDGLAPWIIPGALSLVAIVLAATVALGWVMLKNERARADELTQKNQMLLSALQRVEGQLISLAKPAALAPVIVELPPPPPPPAPAPKRPEKRAVVRPAIHQISTVRSEPKEPPRDPRVDPLIQRVEEQAKQQTRDREEWTGSIARTQEEVAELRRRGERTIHEFDLFKNKDFSRVGPLGLSLRKADTKHSSYQMKWRVDDQEMEKKNVSLYEPLLISAPGSPQPLQLVVNQITKDRVRGYISEPKYRAAATSTAAADSGLKVRP